MPHYGPDLIPTVSENVCTKYHSDDKCFKSITSSAAVLYDQVPEYPLSTTFIFCSTAALWNLPGVLRFWCFLNTDWKWSYLDFLTKMGSYCVNWGTAQASIFWILSTFLAPCSLVILFTKIFTVTEIYCIILVLLKLGTIEKKHVIRKMLKMT